MSVLQKQTGIVEPITNLATGGAITLAVATAMDQLRAVTIAQTTAGQAITLPNPVDQTESIAVDVLNVGSADFTMYGATVTAGSFGRFRWDSVNNAWMADLAPTNVNMVVETLTPSSQNTIPDLANAPATGTPQTFFVGCALAPAGITSDAAGSITVAPATLGYNIETFNSVTVHYFV